MQLRVATACLAAHNQEDVRAAPDRPKGKMKKESLHDLQSVFPDIDGFWQMGDLGATERAMTRSLPAFDESAPTVEAVEGLTQWARLKALRGELEESRQMLALARKNLPADGGEAWVQAELRWNLEYGRWLCFSSLPAKAAPFFMEAWDKALKADRLYFAIDAALMMSVIQSPKMRREWLERALKVAEQASTEQARLWLPVLYEMSGWDIFDSRRYEEALTHFEKAVELWRAVDGGARGRSARWAAARVLRALAREEESLARQKELEGELAIAGDVNGYVDLEIAECLLQMGRGEEAKPRFEAAHKWLSADRYYADNHPSELERIKKMIKQNL